ncbi:unnamed protein product [Mucor hiemalis]
MSNPFDEDSDGLEFDNRTTRDSFNERLLRAREDSEHELEPHLELNDFSNCDDTNALEEQIKLLEKRVMHMEKQADHLEEKLTKRREKRVKEASLTNLSPEARAEFVTQQEKEMKEGESAGLDVIFEYLLLLGSTPADDTNDLSSTDFLKPHAGIRKKAMDDPRVKSQELRSKLHFIEANNVLESNPDDEGDIRHCELKGTSYHENFTLTFDVLEPSMIMNNLMYDVDIEMNVAIGDVLDRVKEDCDLLGFFRILTHYSVLGNERRVVFDKLKNRYNGTEISVEVLSESRLKFEGNQDCEAYFILEWKTKTVNTGRNRLDANATDHVQPDISLEAVRSRSVNERDTEFHLGRINEKFLDMLKIQGVYAATETIINKSLPGNSTIFCWCRFTGFSIPRLKNTTLINNHGFQNRVGSKHRSGGVASFSESNVDCRERLRKLAMETIDIAKDPYFMKNHLVPTSGKKHQTNLARRAAKEAKENNILQSAVGPAKPLVAPRRNVIKIGRPGYRVTKVRDPVTRQLGFLFQIQYPQIADNVIPRHKFMGAYEQKIEQPNNAYQYLVVAAEPYEFIAFKIQSSKVDETPGKFWTHWD